MKTKLPTRWLARVLPLAVGFTASMANGAVQPRELQIDDYFALQTIGSPVISPDGNGVAYTVGSQDLANDSRETRIWMIPTAGGEPRPMTAKGSSAWSPRWSPDGKHLSFIAMSHDDDDASSQVFTLDPRGGERVQLTDVAGGVEGYEWSPNGERLVLVIRDRKAKTGPGPWVIDRLTFKRDYVGYLDRLRGHLYAYDIESESLTQVTGGDYETTLPPGLPTAVESPSSAIEPKSRTATGTRISGWSIPIHLGKNRNRSE